MVEPKYTGDFTSRDDVAQAYDVRIDDFPTDEQIVYAGYETPPYEGYSFVLFERDGKLYEVNGSHCSCYGLEGEWRPEETTWDALAIRQPSEYGAPQQVITEAKQRASKQA